MWLLNKLILVDFSFWKLNSHYFDNQGQQHCIFKTLPNKNLLTQFYSHIYSYTKKTKWAKLVPWNLHNGPNTLGPLLIGLSDKVKTGQVIWPIVEQHLFWNQRSNGPNNLAHFSITNFKEKKLSDQLGDRFIGWRP